MKHVSEFGELKVVVDYLLIGKISMLKSSSSSGDPGIISLYIT